MMPLIIDATDGTVLHMSNCYIVFDETFTDEEEWCIQMGSDSEISELAKNEGIPLDEDALEWIQYGRWTSISYGPSALRYEAKETLAEFGPIMKEEERGWLEWVVNSATDAELVWLGKYILENKVFDNYRKNLMEALQWRASYPDTF